MSISLNQAMYQQIASLVQGLVTKKGMKNVKTEILTVIFSFRRTHHSFFPTILNYSHC